MKTLNTSNGRIEVALDYGKIWLRSDDVLMVTLEKGATIRFREARKIMDTIQQLSKITQRAIVLDIRPANVDMAARIVFTGERFAAVKKSVALIVPNFFAKATSNLSFLLDGPTFPIKAFLSESEALRWSRQYAQ